ncbi:uncharacterized protein LOC103943452 isoform X2 [Pyrus x bretschneideri]|uniref:uncharacterized protein LOC103943452 isoform X2 n=1 Tax=Pyrus x bretschneideri TaxID=225117 RepID=UPI00202EEB71|nr:uncharacterized protein LOC103943452 isoform X2 [Pyrus x bretschneideri]
MKILQDKEKSTEKQFPRNDQQNGVSEVPTVDSGSVSISSSKSTKVTREDIEVVQNLVERCLRLYMNKNEVVNTLLDRARIEPGFTSLVLEKLEVENAEFFKAYYMRLKLKNQIVMYNRLLEQQYHLMKQQEPPEVPLPPLHNGMHYMPVNNLPMGYPVMQQPPFPSKGHHQINSMGTISSCHLVNGIPAHGNFHHMPLNLCQDIKTEMVSSPVSVSNGQFPYTPSEISGLGADTSMLDPAFTHFANLERFSDEADSGKLSGQAPWNFSLIDTAGWPNLPDLGSLGNYSGSPFLPSDPDIMLGSPEQNDMVEEFFVDPGQGSQSD